MKFIPLCFLLSLLVLINTKPLQGAELEPVVDDEGNPLQPGVGYYAWPLWAKNTGLGGITLGHTRNKTCPLDVIRDPKSIGVPIFFTAPNFLDFIPTLTDLTISTRILTPCVHDSRIWKITKVADFWFVSTRGILGDLTTKFKIVKIQGDIYIFMFCPDVPYVICTTVGTFVDSDGTKVLALGAGVDKPYYFRFHKASSTLPLIKMYQDLSGV